MKVWVGISESLLPASNSGIKNGLFPYKSPSDPLTTDNFGFVIEMSSIASDVGVPADCNSLYYVYAHADVIYNGAGQTAYGGESCLTSQ